jgi:hypothetical protein
VGEFSRIEIEQAFRHYQDIAREAGRSGEWGPWAELFTEDATYVEHHFGTFQGRDAIRSWIVATMATPPNNDMTMFPVEWSVIDDDRGWVVCCIWNRMNDPGDGSVHQAANWTLLKYAGGGCWSYEEDLYNPAEFAHAVKQWLGARKIAAGG